MSTFQIQSSIHALSPLPFNNSKARFSILLLSFSRFISFSAATHWIYTPPAKFFSFSWPIIPRKRRKRPNPWWKRLLTKSMAMILLPRLPTRMTKRRRWRPRSIASSAGRSLFTESSAAASVCFQNLLKFLFILFICVLREIVFDSSRILWN